MAEILYHYVLIRADLSHGRALAQNTHAAGVSGQLLPYPIPKNTCAVALDAPSEDSLRDLSARLTYEGIAHTLVCEPDAPFFNQAVALGIVPTPKERLRKLLGKFQLIR